MFACPVRDFQEKFFSLLSILYVPRAPQIDLFCRGDGVQDLGCVNSRGDGYMCHRPP